MFSIEAFVHGPDPAGYLRAAAGLLRPGGRLVIVDDLLAAPLAGLAAADARLVERFRRGWRVGSLVTADELRALAVEAGLAPLEERDLTAHLELRRPRDRAIALMLAAGRPLRPRGEHWRALDGGDALQRALLRGLLAYHLLAFERPAA